MSGRTIILALNPDALQKKLRGIYFDQRLTALQRYFLLLYVILPIVLIFAFIIGFALSVYYQGWVNFMYSRSFVPAPYRPGDIIHHYK